MAFTAVLILVLISSLYWTDFGGWGHRLDSTRQDVFEHQAYWKLLTSLGVHADLKHLLSNSLFFGILAFILNGYFGWVAFPVLSLLLGIATQAITLQTYAPEIRLMGASGMVYSMAGLWLTLNFGTERRLSLIRRAFNAAAFVMVLFIPSQLEPQISYRAHAIGFVLGAVFGAPLFFARRHQIRAAEEIESEHPEDTENPEHTEDIEFFEDEDQ